MEEENNEDYIAQLEQAVHGMQDKNVQLNTALSSSNYGKQDPNLIQYQLDTDYILEKLEHFYRGDYIGFDKKNNQIWKSPSNKEMITFNEFGVSSLMEIVTKYIDKNTSLSYYPEERYMRYLEIWEMNLPCSCSVIMKRWEWILISRKRNSG